MSGSWLSRLVARRPQTRPARAKELQDGGAILLDGAVNMTGGMRAWQRAGLPAVASGGRPGRVA